MKKIAFIEEGFLGSTLPLAREFCRRGYAVDLYFIRNEIHEPEGCECDYCSPHYGICKIPSKEIKQIKEYVSPSLFQMYTICLTMPYHSIPVVRNIADLAIAIQLKHVARKINSMGYEMVNIVANYNFDRYRHFFDYLADNVALSLHEVADHFCFSNKPYPLLKKAIKKGIPLVVFSRNTMQSAQKIQGICPNNIFYIPFGLFDSFKNIPAAELPESIPEKFILFYGYILPYKGLSVLYEAVRVLGEELGDYRVVVAGKGYDPIIDEIKEDSRFCLIQRFLFNREIVFLLQKAYAVVCPYITMSQSGIPQTSFVFSTPVIASDLDGFKEVLNPDNSILFRSNDAQSLAQAIRKLIKDKGKRDIMSNNIKNYYRLNPQYAWDKICDKYIQNFHL